MMNSYTDLMVDIETLGLQTDAVVLSIGAVAFDRNVLDDFHSFDIDGSRYFYNTLEIQPQLDKGRTVTASTLEFWKKQPEMPERKAGLLTVFAAFNVWLYKNFQQRDFCVWAKGPDFDIVILENLYRMHVHVQVPPMPPLFQYWQARDVRTAVDLSQNPMQLLFGGK